MHSHDVLAPLVTSALLAQRSELSASERSRIISCTPSVYVQEPEAAWEVVVCAFQEARLPIPWRRRPSLASLRGAIVEAERWTELGVSLISAETIQAPNAAEHDVPQVLFARGNCSMLQQPAAAILNSRKPLQTFPSDSWLQATKNLVSRARKEDVVIVSSYGNIAYAMTSWLAKGTRLLVVCDGPLPFMESSARCLDFLNRYEGLFDFRTALFISPFSPGRLPSRASRLPLRDHLVAALASVVMVADVRPRGNMAAVLNLVARRGIPVVLPEEGCVQQRERSDPETSMVTQCRKEPQRRVQRAPDLSHYLIHYARSCPGPWPGQTIAEYCKSLADGEPGSGHTAFDALQRILDEGLIRGSSKLTRGPLPMVSFTECMPGDIGRIITWRPGLVRWSFERYGIGVPRDVLKELGARPVLYGPEGELALLDEDDRPFFQVRKPDATDWSNEREWRLRGDLDLGLVPLERLVAIVLTDAEASAIRDRLGCLTVALDSQGFEQLGRP